MLLSVLLFAAGLTILYFGAEFLIKGGAQLGLQMGLSPLAVGLTIIAFGTSAPELAVSLNAAWLGQTDVAMGNVVGSNISNIGLILGLSALIQPLQVHQRMVRIDIPIMIASGILLLLLLFDETLVHWEGILLLAGIFAFTAFNFYLSKHAPAELQAEIDGDLDDPPPNSTLKNIVLFIAGILLLTWGARWMVDSATTMAQLFGISEAVIGLTIVAIGTSLPELATSILAASKRMGDLSVGNIVGSNIFNILSVLGATAAMKTIPMGNVNWLDMTIMMAFMVIVLPVALFGRVITRSYGAGLLLCYIAYISWRVLYS